MHNSTDSILLFNTINYVEYPGGMIPLQKRKKHK